MKPTTLHNLTWIPLMIVSFIAIVLGCAWLISDTPWLLDKEANEALLQLTFDKLFAAEINAHLPDYLTLVYRLFGWWVITIGMLLGSFVQVTKMGTTLARNTIHGVLIVMIIGFYSIEYTFIPSSPFVLLTHGITLMTGLSIWAGNKLKRFDS